MTARRLLAVAALACCAGPGCRALGVSPGRANPVAPAPSLAVAQIVEDHNRNAELVRSLEATPTVSVNGRLRTGGSASGRMAVVRPHDFRLTLNSHRGDVADFGSNDQEFWIWMAGSERKEYYVGHYDQYGEAPGELMLQPEWITEALGLRVIPDSEAQAIRTEAGDADSSITLVHHRTGPNGQPTIKRTVVSKQTGLILEHRFYTPDGKRVLARVMPSEYRRVPIPGGEGEAGASVVMPTHLRLKITPPQQDESDVTLVLGNAPKLNQFSDSRRASLFRVPSFEDRGYARVDLDEMLTGAQRNAAQVRETMPAPPAGGRVRLEDPVSVGIDGEARRASDPAPLAADLPGSQGGIVGARIPRPPDGYGPEPIGEASALEAGGRLR